MIENGPLTEHGSAQRESTSHDSGPDFQSLIELVRDVGSEMANNNLKSIDIRYQGLRLSMISQNQPAPAPVQSTRNGRQSDEPTTSAPVEVDPAIHTVSAPMIGTFYAAPAPNEPPFVNTGDVVEEGQTIGIIEAMKIMNEIASDMQGEVVDVIAKNGETVEFGSPLVTLRTDG